MQNVTILGLTLQDRTLQEKLATAKRYLTNGALDVVAYVDHDVLSKASKNKNVKEFILNAGMTLWENTRILKLVGVTGQDRYEDVGNRLFLKELLDILTAQNESIVIAASDDEALETLAKEIKAFAPEIEISHESVIELNQIKIPEKEINGINEHSPRVVIARADYGLQHEWLKLARPMINVGIWLALPPGMNLETSNVKKEYLVKKIWHKVSFRLFKRRAARANGGTK